jgi:hypothetical protein
MPECTTRKGQAKVIVMPKKPTYEKLEKRVQELEQAESKRKRSEEQLIHSHDLMDYIISHARSSIAVHDKDLKYINWLSGSPAQVRRWGRCWRRSPSTGPL